jgi:hypothetical protein
MQVVISMGVGVLQSLEGLKKAKSKGRRDSLLFASSLTGCIYGLGFNPAKAPLFSD